MAETFRNEIIHLTVSFILMLAFIPQLGVTVSFLVIFSFGFFLDLDHLFDYGLYLKNKKQKFKIKDFLSGQHFHSNHRMYVFLHSWELVILLWIFHLYSGGIAFWTASFALLSHLIVDQLTNHVNYASYFFIYRYRLNFQHVC